MSELKVRKTGEIIEIQNVFCVGRNYAEHIKEIYTGEGVGEVPAEPVVFLKPNSAVNSENGIVTIPERNGNKISHDLQNEVEMVIVIGKDGKNISEDKAISHVLGYSAGVDFTLRDLQAEMKKNGLPWAVAKGFYTSAPVSDITLKEDISDVNNLNIKLSVNGETRQDANTSQMIFSVNYMIHYISSIFSLRRGDIIFTGTPAGVSTLKVGDKIDAEIENIGKLSVKVI